MFLNNNCLLDVPAHPPPFQTLQMQHRQSVPEKASIVNLLFLHDFYFKLSIGIGFVMKEAMSALSPETIRIAIPSYDRRVSPRFDQAREFHIADIDLRHRQCRELSALVCPQPPYMIGDWLSELGTHGVICSGIHQHHQHQLLQLGIWLIWGISGEIDSILDHWLQSDELQSLINELPKEKTLVCQAH